MLIKPPSFIKFIYKRFFFKMIAYKKSFLTWWELGDLYLTKFCKRKYSIISNQKENAINIYMEWVYFKTQYLK